MRWLALAGLIALVLIAVEAVGTPTGSPSLGQSATVSSVTPHQTAQRLQPNHSPTAQDVAATNTALLWQTPSTHQVAGDPKVTIVIPFLGVQAPVYDRGLDAEGQMPIAPGYALTHYQFSAGLGEHGNYVAYGHDDIEGNIFHYLPMLRIGDQIDLYQGRRHYRYLVTGSSIVAPTDIAVLAPSRAATLTLISCTPYRVDTRRIVVWAKLAEAT